MGFVAVPAAEAGGVVGEEDVEEDNEGFGSLGGSLVRKDGVVRWYWGLCWRLRMDREFTMPRAMVLDLVRGTFLMNSRERIDPQRCLRGVLVEGGRVA